MSFEPKEPVQLQPPSDQPITLEELYQCDGVKSPYIYVAIKGTVFDVTHNSKAYGVGQGYHALVGRDASKALGKSSLKPEDLNPAECWDYSDLNEKQLQTLENWFTFFSKRYNIVGKVVGLPGR
ncbi:Hypothetical protein PP7435_CHR2-2067 [Komagataella phaffii CBS 7435]|uniref:Cytochrome b5 heme-binding domain-containing protein n=1 Tax=Komagataella phaffii (strain ATCC 76273 / CBS 7435 / CECT 11047 / NRRL Y-11430 / Wegner 21-1) TaxID=981350 RepID=A0A1G4KPX9_KOMPC|nr:Hypothetical protein BQ9382_C2-3355 [Komagataella phaffii CBS 7435]SCV12040.1 Hypothetical protein PP7435_CHR2-2067 [Komagataella phaffii CBS 7435]